MNIIIFKNLKVIGQSYNIICDDLKAYTQNDIIEETTGAQNEKWILEHMACW